MVENIYVQAFKRRWTKITLMASYRTFRCPQWSAAWPPPCLSIVLSMEKEWWASWWRWSLYSTWPFPLSSFKSSPMLSVLLSVEELELLIIPYWHAFENHLRFLSLWLIFPSTSFYYHQAMVPILHHIIITDFHPVLVTASFSTIFLFPPEYNMYWNTPPSWSSWSYLSNEPSYAWNGFRTRELCQFYSGDAICPKWFQTRNAQCFCHISLYGSSKLMILDALERNFEGASEY
jgi:hypothetical protein